MQVWCLDLNNFHFVEKRQNSQLKMKTLPRGLIVNYCYILIFSVSAAAQLQKCE